MLLEVRRLWGLKRPHKHWDLTFWLQGPLKGGYQKACFVPSLCLCGLLGSGKVAQLSGSWDLVPTCNWAYNLADSLLNGPYIGFQQKVGS